MLWVPSKSHLLYTDKLGLKSCLSRQPKLLIKHHPFTWNDDDNGNICVCVCVLKCSAKYLEFPFV